MRLAILSAAVAVSIACGGSPQSGGRAAPAPKATADGPAPAFEYPAPVKGHIEEANTGTFDLVDGLAFPATGGEGTVVYVTSKAIASPALAGSTCPMTQARAISVLRNASYAEVTIDASGARSPYYALGSAYGGRSREEDVGGRYWKITARRDEGRIAGSVTYKGRGRFEFDLPVSKPGMSEVSEGDRVQGRGVDSSRRTPTEAEVIAAYSAVRKAALAKDLKGMLAAQGFDAKQIEAIRGLPGIDADLQAHKDRFLTPGTPEEPRMDPGEGAVGGQGVNSKQEKFFNFYQFAPCGNALVLISIGENPQ
jgi:hypothetical protein